MVIYHSPSAGNVRPVPSWPLLTWIYQRLTAEQPGRGHTRAEVDGHKREQGEEAGKATASTAHWQGKRKTRGDKNRSVPNYLPFRIRTQITDGITRIFLSDPNHPPPRIWVTIWD